MNALSIPTKPLILAKRKYMPHSFTAIDFETAQGYRHSICQVGLVRIENWEVVKTINILVQPPDNYYWPKFIDIHGITPQMTAKAPTFDKIWHQIEPFIAGQNVVAHNIPFDHGCLKATLEHYNIPPPEYKQHCTLKLYGKGLASCCKEHNIQLNHHDALSDAMACAVLFGKWLMKKNEKLISV
jgi:DNA polymerase-3 subunit epsilon